jgi:hypothetical protein
MGRYRSDKMGIRRILNDLSVKSDCGSVAPAIKAHSLIMGDTLASARRKCPRSDFTNVG